MGLLLVGDVLTVPRPMGPSRELSPYRVCPTGRSTPNALLSQESRGTRLKAPTRDVAVPAGSRREKPIGSRREKSAGERPTSSIRKPSRVPYRRVAVEFESRSTLMPLLGEMVTVVGEAAVPLSWNR